MSWANILSGKQNNININSSNTNIISNNNNNNNKNNGIRIKNMKRYQKPKTKYYYKKIHKETRNIPRQKLENDLYDIIFNIKDELIDNCNYLLENVSNITILDFIKQYYNISPLMEISYLRYIKKQKRRDNLDKKKVIIIDNRPVVLIDPVESDISEEEVEINENDEEIEVEELDINNNSDELSDIDNDFY
jgi:hypothetical protein